MLKSKPVISCWLKELEPKIIGYRIVAHEGLKGYWSGPTPLKRTTRKLWEPIKTWGLE